MFKGSRHARITDSLLERTIGKAIKKVLHARSMGCLGRSAASTATKIGATIARGPAPTHRWCLFIYKIKHLHKYDQVSRLPAPVAGSRGDVPAGAKRLAGDAPASFRGAKPTASSNARQIPRHGCGDDPRPVPSPRARRGKCRRCRGTRGENRRREHGVVLRDLELMPLLDARPLRSSPRQFFRDQPTARESQSCMPNHSLTTDGSGR